MLTKQPCASKPLFNVTSCSTARWKFPFFLGLHMEVRGRLWGVLCLAEDPKLEGVFAHTAASSLDTQLVIATDKKVYNCSPSHCFLKRIS